MMRRVRLSIGLFTLIPVAPHGPSAPTRAEVRGAVLLAPAVGLLVGLVGAVALWGVRVLLLPDGISPKESAAGALLTAALAWGAVQSVTGAMHLDGLADTVDGMAARADRERTLSIMRRSDIGPMGAVAAAFALMVQIGSLALAELRGHGTIAVVTAAIVGRLAAVWACRLPAARGEGLGAWVAGTVTTAQAVTVSAAAIVVPLALVARDDDPAVPVLFYVPAAAACALVVAGVLQRWWRRRIGGITGDTLGAGIEVATTVALLVVAAAR